MAYRQALSLCGDTKRAVVRRGQWGVGGEAGSGPGGGRGGGSRGGARLPLRAVVRRG